MANTRRIKKVIAIACACVILIVGMVCAATNADRIKELQDGMRQDIVEIQGQQQDIQQAQNRISELQADFQRKQGAVEELQRLDAEAAKNDGKKTGAGNAGEETKPK